MKKYLFIGLSFLLLLAACSGGEGTISITNPGLPSQVDALSSVDSDDNEGKRGLEIVTLLPKDGIPAINNPLFVPADEADLLYDPDELVIGVNFDGDARAYSIPMLSSHEIVNDTVGGRKIAVTW